MDSDEFLLGNSIQPQHCVILIPASRSCQNCCPSCGGRKGKMLWILFGDAFMRVVVWHTQQQMINIFLIKGSGVSAANLPFSELFAMKRGNLPFSELSGDAYYNKITLCFFFFSLVTTKQS
jgi:hypothetical protein